jgi:hypothetical protein
VRTVSTGHRVDRFIIEGALADPGPTYPASYFITQQGAEKFGSNRRQLDIRH